jgi:hypothetical protein
MKVADLKKLLRAYSLPIGKGKESMLQRLRKKFTLLLPEGAEVPSAAEVTDAPVQPPHHHGPTEYMSKEKRTVMKEEIYGLLRGKGPRQCSISTCTHRHTHPMPHAHVHGNKSTRKHTHTH